VAVIAVMVLVGYMVNNVIRPSTQEEKMLTAPVSAPADAAGQTSVPAPTPPLMGAARQETAAVKGPQFKVSTEGIKQNYAVGELVSFEAKMTNTTNDTIVLDPFPPAVTITTSGEEKVVRTLPAGTNKVTALPGETVVFSVAWDQKDDSGNQVPAGSYVPVVSLMSGAQSIGSTQTGAVITIE
jgi:hypothetical protein